MQVLGMTDWQPIETVPKGEQLLFADASNVIAGFWNYGEKEPRMAHTGGEFPIWPTHWMPLPEPPPTPDSPHP